MPPAPAHAECRGARGPLPPPPGAAAHIHTHWAHSAQPAPLARNNETLALKSHAHAQRPNPNCKRRAAGAASAAAVRIEAGRPLSNPHCAPPHFSPKQTLSLPTLPPFERRTSAPLAPRALTCPCCLQPCAAPRRMRFPARSSHTVLTAPAPYSHAPRRAAPAHAQHPPVFFCAHRRLPSHFPHSQAAHPGRFKYDTPCAIPTRKHAHPHACVCAHNRHHAPWPSQPPAMGAPSCSRAEPR